MSKKDTSIANDARSPRAMTPVTPLREGRAPREMTPVAAATPTEPLEKGRQPGSITPVTPPKTSPNQSGGSGKPTDKK